MYGFDVGLGFTKMPLNKQSRFSWLEFTNKSYWK